MLFFYTSKPSETYVPLLNSSSHVIRYITSGCCDMRSHVQRKVYMGSKHSHTADFTQSYKYKGRSRCTKLPSVIAAFAFNPENLH